MVANFDLANFFSNIQSGRVYELFCRLGCSPDVARLLTGLTTFKGRIPQGAPTSTMLANLVVGCYSGEHSFSSRLQTLAVQHGGESSIWVDDLTISGPPYLPRLAPTVDRIARQCGFTLNPHKNFFQSQGKRQIVTGLIVNEKPNIPREEYRRIRALLYKCRRLGPRAVVEQSSSAQSVSKLQERLRGKIAYVQSVNTAQGAKLLEQFNAIDWSE